MSETLARLRVEAIRAKHLAMVHVLDKARPNPSRFFRKLAQPRKPPLRRHEISDASVRRRQRRSDRYLSSGGLHGLESIQRSLTGDDRFVIPAVGHQTTRVPCKDLGAFR